MKRVQISRIVGRLAALSLVGGALLLGIARAYARSSQISSPQNSVVDDDVTMVRKNVYVPWHVNGEVAVAGSNVTVAGPVSQDVMAAGGNVYITGKVGEDLRAAGRDVTLSSAVTKNASLFGRTIVVDSTGSVGRNAHIMANQVWLDGPVKHNLAIVAQNAELASEVGGSVEARVGNLRLLPGALVHGNLVVVGPNRPQISTGAKVLGAVEYRKGNAARGNVFAGWMETWAMEFLALVILGAGLLIIARPWTDQVVDTMIRQTGKSILIGIVGLIVVPLISILLIISLIGLPLGALLLTLYAAALLLADVFVAYLIGGRVMRRKDGRQPAPFTRMALGALILSFCTTLPWIGWPILIVVLIVGLGSVATWEHNEMTRLRLA